MTAIRQAKYSKRSDLGRAISSRMGRAGLAADQAPKAVLQPARILGSGRIAHAPKLGQVGCKGFSELRLLRISRVQSAVKPLAGLDGLWPRLTGQPLTGQLDQIHYSRVGSPAPHRELRRKSTPATGPLARHAVRRQPALTLGVQVGEVRSGQDHAVEQFFQFGRALGANVGHLALIAVSGGSGREKVGQRRGIASVQDTAESVNVLAIGHAKMKSEKCRVKSKAAALHL